MSEPLQHDFRRRHPDWKHKPVEWTREQWARIASLWSALVESQNGEDVDDYAFPEDGGLFGEYARELRGRQEVAVADLTSGLWRPKLLVLGCGVAHDVAWARRYGWDATGITLAPMNVAVAHELHPELPKGAVLMLDMHSTGLPPGILDAVIGMHTLEHSWAPLMLLMECARLLRPGGWAFFRTPQARDFTGGQELHHVLCPTGRQVHGLMEKAGFKEVEHSIASESDLESDTLVIGRRWREGEEVSRVVREFTR